MLLFKDIASTIILLGIFLAFFSSAVLLTTRHGSRQANKWLALFCIGVAGFLLRSYLMISGFYTRIPLITELVDNVRYLLCPALYFYIRTAADNQFHFQKYDTLHLVPLSFNLIVKSQLYFSAPDDQLRFLSQWLNGSMMQPAFYWDSASRALFFIYFCFFLFLSIRNYLSARTQIERSAPFGRIYSSWITLFILAFFPIIVLWLLSVIFVALKHPFLPFYYAMHVFTAFMVFSCIFILFLHPEIVYRAKPLRSDKKYIASYLSHVQADRHFERLQYFMEKEEEYENPDLDLQSLAEKLSITKNYLSQIINEKTGKTFNDFINGYRIEKVKRLLEDSGRKEETVLALAFEAGFNSKTPFNNAFKKHTGQSPVIYRKRHLK